MASIPYARSRIRGRLPPMTAARDLPEPVADELTCAAQLAMSRVSAPVHGQGLKFLLTVNLQFGGHDPGEVVEVVDADIASPVRTSTTGVVDDITLSVDQAVDGTISPLKVFRGHGSQTPVRLADRLRGIAGTPSWIAR